MNSLVKTKLFENVTYDSEVNACYIKVNTETVADTYESTEDCWVDISADGQVVGIEILNASRHFELINNILLSQTPIEECVLY